MSPNKNALLTCSKMSLHPPDLFLFLCRNMLQWWKHLYLKAVILVLLMVMESFETQIIDVLFDMVEPGQSIMGKLETERHARKQLECSSM